MGAVLTRMFPRVVWQYMVRYGCLPSYANSVLQVLFYCPLLREAVMQKDAACVSPSPRSRDTMHSSFVRLFHAMALGGVRLNHEVRHATDAVSRAPVQVRRYHVVDATSGARYTHDQPRCDQVVPGHVDAELRPVRHKYAPRCA